MARKISNAFLQELKLKDGCLNPILNYVKSDDTLNMELRGDSVAIYYRGGKLLSIKEKSFELIALDSNYHKESGLISPTVENIEDYIPKAKRIVDKYVVEVKNHLWEKEIQQRIVQENNYSRNSYDTDFFIIDTEYQDIGRADIVALCWESNASARKLSKNRPLKITIFEVKQGIDSIKGNAGMYSHWNDFNTFIAGKDKVESFKKDMIAVFEQKRELGLIIETEKLGKVDITKVSDDIDFVFLLANYKSASANLREELDKIPDCKFIYANPMGYGLYLQNIVGKQKFIERFILVTRTKD